MPRTRKADPSPPAKATLPPAEGDYQKLLADLQAERGERAMAEARVADLEEDLRRLQSQLLEARRAPEEKPSTGAPKPAPKQNPPASARDRWGW